jgi:uroporphyrinogen decarboxylase
MTRRERVVCAIRGEPVDRVPHSLWYHFGTELGSGHALARATVDFARSYRPDVLKVMNDTPYEVRPGASGLDDPSEWASLTTLDGRSGHFSTQLDALRQIREALGPDWPIVSTVFGAYATGDRLTGGRLLEHLRRDPSAVRAGLERLSDSLANHARAAILAGADGVFLSLQGAAADTQSYADYASVFPALEQRILAAASGGTMNVVHQHGIGIYPEVALSMTGLAILSWSSRLSGNPGVREMRLRTQACLMAGVNEVTMGQVGGADVRKEAEEAIRESGGRGFVLAPGCAAPTPPAVSEECLRALGEVCEGTAARTPSEREA